MVIVLLVVIWVAVFLLSLSGSREEPPVRVEWTAWDDEQVALLLEDTPPC